MSPEAQRIAIAEAHFGKGNYRVKAIVHPSPEHYRWYDRKGGLVPTPDYLSDLNAMHEAEKILTEDQLEDYGASLNSIAGTGVSLWSPEHGEIARVAMSSAELRAKAFLKAIRKWRDE